MSGSDDQGGPTSGGRRRTPMQERQDSPIGVAPDGRINTPERSRRRAQVMQSLIPDPLEGMVSQAVEGHALGALLGLAVGDALGTTLEFQPVRASPFPALATGPHTEVTGGGPFNLAAGQVTDDTQMACALMASLADEEEYWEPDVAERYASWKAWAFDIGGQTEAALSAIAGGEHPVLASKRVWAERNRAAAGNGSLMRTAPIGVVFAGDGILRRQASVTDSAITHFDPRCRLACAALNGAIARAVRGDRPPVSAIVDAAETDAAAAAWYLSREDPDLRRELERAFSDLMADLDRARHPDPKLYTDDLHIHRHQGFVRVALRLAFWELVHAPGFREGLVDTVNRGGDADTNGAITGALLGAYHGGDAIPSTWVDTVLSALPEDPGNELTTTYHPRALKAHLEAIYAARRPAR